MSATNTNQVDKLKLLVVQRSQKQSAEIFKLGEILGRVELGKVVTQRAANFSAEYYQTEKAVDFCGESVESYSNPSWAPKRESWVPEQRLAGLGFRLTEDGAGEEMVVTFGLPQHIDAIYGPVLCLVLHNDGLTFRQGRVAHKPMAGDWFIFNDRANHGVKEANGEAVFCGLVLPLERL